ncbi:hypothetical protein [Novosphingobium sp. JCM 18896]|uniref:hypothetical protein n=1 Tax=Novosphingobium sp. JCM 18896 TaxID=2989731 RepID=UPI002221E37B|nr:hypothetical protein [Novosphingobium sp. JCM 18896]MCW1431363.1 hypothetical protein [Novosphingobium sp. JCM 18896]
MSDNYEPELGQMLFGQPGQSLSVPTELEAAMDALQNVFGALHPKLYNPWGNSGARYRWSCFEAHAYDWGDDEQPFNFKWRDFIVSWYKYNGRGMSRNRKMSAAELAEMLRECMTAMLTEQPVDCHAS